MNTPLNKYLLKTFGVSIEDYQIIRPFSKNFLVIKYKNEELVVPFVTGEVEDIFLLGELFLDKDLDDDFVSFSGTFYKGFPLEKNLLLFLRVEREKKNFDFYFITPQKIFVKLPNFYFSSVLNDKYTKLFKSIENKKYDASIKSLDTDNHLIKHLMFSSGIKNI